MTSHNEITEIGHLRLFVEFFVCLDIVCGRYTSDYAYFAFPTILGLLSLLLWNSNQYDLKSYLTGSSFVTTFYMIAYFNKNFAEYKTGFNSRGKYIILVLLHQLKGNMVEL